MTHSEKTKPEPIPDNQGPPWDFCGSGDAELAEVEVKLIVNRGTLGERVISGLSCYRAHKTDYADGITLSAAGKIPLTAGDTIEIVVVPYSTKTTYVALAKCCSLTIERVRQFE